MCLAYRIFSIFVGYKFNTRYLDELLLSCLNLELFILPVQLEFIFAGKFI